MSPIGKNNQEKCALVWLAGQTAECEHASVIQSMLAEPRLPAEPDEGHILAMMAAYPRSHTPREVAYDGYRALYAHLTKPKTKTVWDVRYGEGGWSRYYTRAEALENVERRLQEGRLHVEIRESEVPT
jgi:hypothetical protein